VAEQLAEYKVDKSSWERGPWDDEPDRVDFVHAGFACMALRGPMGNWCGYVGVPKEHPAYGKGYDDVDVRVHGGLTYAARCCGHICHVPQPGMPDDVFWFGFDCGHAFDVSPGLEARMRGIHMPLMRYPMEVYRDLPYVRSEIESLAEQLAAVQSPAPPQEPDAAA
jgi:hypothetical protein